LLLGCNKSNNGNFIADFIFTKKRAFFPADVQFINKSQGDDAFACLWDFGDGQNSNEVSPLHQYKEAGKYLVKLKLIDKGKLKAIKSQEVEIDALPTSMSFNKLQLLSFSVYPSDQTGFNAADSYIYFKVNNTYTTKIYHPNNPPYDIDIPEVVYQDMYAKDTIIGYVTFTSNGLFHYQDSPFFKLIFSPLDLRTYDSWGLLYNDTAIIDDENLGLHLKLKNIVWN
jgi:PKD repeat protein